jgi:hypothetical protein
MKFFSENHSGDVDNHSGRLGFFIHFSPESLFTSRRNPYSHHSGTIIHMPRNPQLDDFAVPGSRLEPADVEFKCDFDGLKPTWLDLLKHVVAMANIGGGTLVFGVDRDGNHVGLRASLLQVLDPANVSNKLRSYASARVASAYRELVQDGKRFGFLNISPAERLVVFESDGNYQGSDGKPGRAFIKGVIYTRVPGSTREAEQLDLDTLMDRLVRHRLGKIVARIEHVARAPLESELVISRAEDTSRGIIVGKSVPVRIVPDRGDDSDGSTAVNVRLAVNDPHAVPITEIADSTIPFSSVNAELQTQVRLWRLDSSHRVSRSALCRLYLHRHELDISPEAAEMCFISAAYGRGYSFFWAAKMDSARLREVVQHEIAHGKSPMTETLPFVVCALMWRERQILSQPATKARLKLKARHIVSTLLNFSSQSEFLRRARATGNSFDLDGRTYTVMALVTDLAAATVVFERLMTLDYESRLDDKLRSFAQRLDLILHTDTQAPA